MIERTLFYTEMYGFKSLVVIFIVFFVKTNKVLKIKFNQVNKWTLIWNNSLNSVI